MFDNFINQYKLISGQKNVRVLQVMLGFLSCPRMRVQLLIIEMKRKKLKLLKKIIRNHLEVKYSIIVSTSCKIGSNLKIEHFFGIVIGNELLLEIIAVYITKLL